jgi:hypothetical protein
MYSGRNLLRFGETYNFYPDDEGSRLTLDGNKFLPY